MLKKEKDRQQMLDDLLTQIDLREAKKQTILIWDLDYYYAQEKINCFNPDVMKISGYHKMRGDKVILVKNELDLISRFDECYIIKEKNTTANPPIKFLLDRRVKWRGKANTCRINWQMSEEMLQARPDYLLYPEHNTALERADQVRLFDNDGHLLEASHNFINAFNKKRFLITDYTETMRQKSSHIDLEKALKMLTNIKNLTFLHPIQLQRLVYNENIQEAFLKLKLRGGTKLEWTPIDAREAPQCIEVLHKIKQKNPQVSTGFLTIVFSHRSKEHWNNVQVAREDYEYLKKAIYLAKRAKVQLHIVMSGFILDTPYYQLFSALVSWTCNARNFKESWIMWLTQQCSGNASRLPDDMFYYWSHPEKWSNTFRTLLRQTYTDELFCICEWGEKNFTTIKLPYRIWNETFKYGL